MVHPLPTTSLRECTEGTFYCLSQWASTVTTGAFWVMMLLAFCFAIFMATIRFGGTRAFGFGSFVGMIGGIFFAILGLMAWWIASVFIIIGVIGLAILFLAEK